MSGTFVKSLFLPTLLLFVLPACSPVASTDTRIVVKVVTPEEAATDEAASAVRSLESRSIIDPTTNVKFSAFRNDACYFVNMNGVGVPMTEINDEDISTCQDPRVAPPGLGLIAGPAGRGQSIEFQRVPFGKKRFDLVYWKKADLGLEATRDCQDPLLKIEIKRDVDNRVDIFVNGVAKKSAPAYILAQADNVDIVYGDNAVNLVAHWGAQETEYGCGANHGSGGGGGSSSTPHITYPWPGWGASADAPEVVRVFNTKGFLRVRCVGLSNSIEVDVLNAANSSLASASASCGASGYADIADISFTGGTQLLVTEIQNGQDLASIDYVLQTGSVSYQAVEQSAGVVFESPNPSNSPIVKISWAPQLPGSGRLAAVMTSANWITQFRAFDFTDRQNGYLSQVGGSFLSNSSELYSFGPSSATDFFLQKIYAGSNIHAVSQNSFLTHGSWNWSSAFTDLNLSLGWSGQQITKLDGTAVSSFAGYSSVEMATSQGQSTAFYSTSLAPPKVFVNRQDAAQDPTVWRSIGTVSPFSTDPSLILDAPGNAVDPMWIVVGGAESSTFSQFRLIRCATTFDCSSPSIEHYTLGNNISSANSSRHVIATDPTSSGKTLVSAKLSVNGSTKTLEILRRSLPATGPITALATTAAKINGATSFAVTSSSLLSPRIVFLKASGPDLLLGLDFDVDPGTDYRRLLFRSPDQGAHWYTVSDSQDSFRWVDATDFERQAFVQAGDPPSYYPASLLLIENPNTSVHRFLLQGGHGF